MAPANYDPHSAEEQPVPLPSAPLLSLGDKIVLQPPLTRRGTGPGLIAFLPSSISTKSSRDAKARLDPEPVQKWAEEGFAVIGVAGGRVADSLRVGVATLQGLNEVDVKDKFAVAVYDPAVLTEVIEAVASDPRLVCIVSYGGYASCSRIPLLVHLPEGDVPTATSGVHRYICASPFFVFPHSDGYHPGSASVAHSRSLVFFRTHLGAPHFDLEAIWDEHTYYEFEVRSVAKTMGTMVAEPYVNHVPTMTGGMGRKDLTAFYRDCFIFSNPADASLETVSRTVGSDRIVEEFVFRCTHDRIIGWLLPRIPPTNKNLVIPMLGVINIRGDRLYHEHIWWDQGTVLLQAGLIPPVLPYPFPDGNSKIRLPISGVESARLLADETDGKANGMLADGYGVID